MNVICCNPNAEGEPAHLVLRRFTGKIFSLCEAETFFGLVNTKKYESFVFKIQLKSFRIQLVINISYRFNTSRSALQDFAIGFHVWNLNKPLLENRETQLDVVVGASYKKCYKFINRCKLIEIFN